LLLFLAFFGLDGRLELSISEYIFLNLDVTFVVFLEVFKTGNEKA
jgi:hypothetical protein